MPRGKYKRTKPKVPAKVHKQLQAQWDIIHNAQVIIETQTRNVHLALIRIAEIAEKL
jgi:hypothetical protein